MLRRIEYLWTQDEWPYSGQWPIYISAARAANIDEAVCAAFQLRQNIAAWEKIPEDLAFLNSPSLSSWGGVFSNSLFKLISKEGLAHTFIRDIKWPTQPAQSPRITIQHFRIINGVYNETRGECIFIYPTPPADVERQQFLTYWECASLFKDFKSQTRMSPNWRLDLPITDAELPQTGLVYIMESEKRGRYKIGWTTREAGERLSEIRTGNSKVRLIASYPATRQVENILHKTFEEKRVREAREAGHEWFDLTEEDLQWIRSVMM